jgi:hypothetical protein
MARDTRDEPPRDPGEKLRQGEIILRTRPRRIIFIAGLVGFVLLALFIQFAARY